MIPLRDVNPTRRRAVVTLGLIAANVAVFAYELLLEAGGGEDALALFFERFGVVPQALTADLQHGAYLTSTTVSLLSSQFLHAGWLHIGVNMLYLWIFGNNVEDLLGRVPYLVFYLAGGIVAATAQVATAPSSAIPLVGASGAISAVLGAYLVWFPRARVLSLVFFGFFYQLVAVPALVVLGFFFVLQLLYGFLALGAASAGGVAYFAHIGGFAVGLIGALALRAGGLVRVPAGFD